MMRIRGDKGFCIVFGIIFLLATLISHAACQSPAIEVGCLACALVLPSSVRDANSVYESDPALDLHMQILHPMAHSVVRRQSVEIEVLITGIEVQ